MHMSLSKTNKSSLMV